ncbi:hypothetical protein [Dipodfec virus UOA04_Rod_663]|nr:hypothetical protein [Dipodfec virus UOA04_Rod_663]
MKQQIVEVLKGDLEVLETEKVRRIHEIWRIEAKIAELWEKYRKLTGEAPYDKIAKEKLDLIVEEDAE